MRTPLAAITLAASFLPSFGLQAQELKFEVRLKRAWAQAFADRTSIDAVMNVRHSHTRANAISSAGEDGDLHFSGVSPDVGLPFVAEIVNAGLPKRRPLVRYIVSAAKSGTVLTISGAWRLWFEHPSSRQTQGSNDPFAPDNTNPDHSFEIHPITRVNQTDVTGSFVPIPGYHAYSAGDAFGYFDKCVVRIKASNSGISIRSKRLRFNYVEFEMELMEAPKHVQDGWIALATVLKAGDEDAADGPRRMIFVQGTLAAQVIQNAEAGDRFRVLGIPRINLSAVLAMVNEHGTSEFDAQLPYEMIIVGIL